MVIYQHRGSPPSRTGRVSEASDMSSISSQTPRCLRYEKARLITSSPTSPPCPTDRGVPAAPMPSVERRAPPTCAWGRRQPQGSTNGRLALQNPPSAVWRPWVLNVQPSDLFRFTFHFEFLFCNFPLCHYILLRWFGSLHSLSKKYTKNDAI